MNHGNDPSTHLPLRTSVGLVAMLVAIGILSACQIAPLPHQNSGLGIIDLSDWNPDQDGPATLDGTWKAWPNILLISDGLEKTGHLPPAFPAPFPGLWSQIRTAHTPLGVVSYQVTILLPVNPPPQLVLQIAQVQSAMRLYANGRLCKEAGLVGKTPEEYHPGYSQGLVTIPIDSPILHLTLEVANFNDPRPGILQSFIIGIPAEMSRYQTMHLAYEIAIFSSLAVLALFILMFFIFRNRELSLLFLALFSLLMGLRYLFLGYRFPFIVEPNIDWEMFQRVHYISYYLAIAVFMQFLVSNFPDPKYRPLVITTWVFAGAYTLFCMVVPEIVYAPKVIGFHIFSALAIGFFLLVLVRAIRSKKPDAWLFFSSTLFLASGALIDTILYYYPVNQPQITSPMVLTFMFFQTVVLSWRFNADFKLSRNLAAELRRILKRQDQIQEGLEKTVIERTQALRLALEKVTVASKAKNEFLANISHEIRTPLNAIIGVCEVLSEAHRNQQENASVRLILSEATRLLHLMNQILDISKIEANKLILENHPFDCREMFQTVLSTMSLRTVSSDVRYHQNIADSVPRYVRGDPLRLRQILDNLLANALKFTENGSISLSVHAIPGPDQRITLHCSLADTGIGIPHERLDSVFQNFQQVDSSTTRIYGGSGLGTSISRSLVELMGGSIQLESEPGKGSRFSFTVLLDPASEGEVPDSHLKDHETEPFWENSPHILLVEDYLLNAEIIARHLTNAGWLVSTATNGEIAVETFFQETYDLVLMDIHMPVMDGLEATRRIRAGAERKVPIIGLSASAFKEDYEQCHQAGMNELVAKPVRRLALLETLARFVPPGAYVENSTSYLSQAVARQVPAKSNQLMEELDGDLGLFLTMVFGFIKDSRHSLDELRLAMSHNDTIITHRLAHTIKGGALNVGATKLSQAALILEQAAKQGLTENWGALLVELESQISHLETSIK